jgi:hypothetical protein
MEEDVRLKEKVHVNPHVKSVHKGPVPVVKDLAFEQHVKDWIISHITKPPTRNFLAFDRKSAFLLDFSRNGPFSEFFSDTKMWPFPETPLLENSI